MLEFTKELLDRSKDMTKTTENIEDEFSELDEALDLLSETDGSFLINPEILSRAVQEEQKIENYTDFVDTVHDDMNENIRNLEIELSDASKKYSELTSQKDFLQDRSDALTLDSKLVDSLQTTLEILENKINALIHMLESLGLELDEVNIDALEELKSKSEELHKKIEVSKEQLASLEDKIEAVKIKIDTAKKNLENTKEETLIFEEHLEPIYKQVDMYAEQHHLSDEDKEVLLNAAKDLETKLSEYNIPEADQEKIISDMTSFANESVLKLKEEIDNFDIDFKEVFENATMNAGVGAGFGAVAGGVGAVPGAITGAISGVVGALSKQYALHLGASEGVSVGIQVVAESFSVGGMIKNIGFGIEKVLVSHGDNLVKQGFEMETKPLTQMVEDAQEFIHDHAKIGEYTLKGLLNDAKVHTFVDGNGKEFFARIDEVIDATRTIKMDYLGSNVRNTNSAGFERNTQKFAQKYLENYPETLSKNNMNLIKNGFAPRVDNQWIKYNPNHKSFLGERLEHHHINNMGEAGYIPTSLHRIGSNKDAIHVDSMNLSKELASLVQKNN